MNNVLKIGIIGLGRMGKIRANLLLQHPEVRLVCAADPDISTHAALPHIRCYTHYQQVLESGLDAVFIATPNCFTKEIVLAALEMNKHVFCEKPPGCTIEDVESIIQTSRLHPCLKLKVGFNHRYHASVLEALRLVSSGNLGRLLWMRGVYGKSGGPGFEQNWRSRKEMAGGGILLDQGIHMLDLFRLFAGPFTEVKSMVNTAFWPIEVEDNAFALLRDTAGRIAMLHSSSTLWKHRFALELCLTEGQIVLDGILSSTKSYGDECLIVIRRKQDESESQEESVRHFTEDDSLSLEIADFIHCISNDKPVENGTIHNTLEAMKLVFAIYSNDAANSISSEGL